MKNLILSILLLSVSPIVLANDDQMYCDYAHEKATAEQILFQSPKVTLGGGRDSIGTTNAIGLGISESLSTYLKGRISQQIGNQDCELYKHVNAITKHVNYDVPSLQLAYQKHRIDTIADAIIDLQKVQSDEVTRVQAGTSTILIVDTINSAIEKLQVELTNLKEQVALTIIPETGLDTRLDQLLLEITTIENEQQHTMAKQSKYDNWDVSLSVGVGATIKSVAIPQAPVEPFVMLSGNYSFGAGARNRALDKAANSYSNYVASQQTGPIHLAEQLYGQVDHARAANNSALYTYRKYQGNLFKNIDSLKGIDTPEAHRLNVQLTVELIQARIETESGRFNVVQMDEYLNNNFASK